VKNRYSDKAFEILSLCVDDSKFLYAQNFQSVCDYITHGFAEYGILPLADTQGGIETVNRLLSAYELKICAVCDIATQEDSTTRFALISDKLFINLETENRYFSFSFNSDEPHKIQSVLYASSLYGLSLYDMKVTRSYSGASNYKLTFRENSGALDSLIVYLKLFLPQFLINGIYFEI
jgi:prephenate dehydratase